MSTPGLRVLVVAKAPVAGRVKTRLGADVGLEDAAGLAAAALADTLAAAAALVGPARCHLSLEGDLAAADVVDGAGLRGLVEGWTITPQRGDLLGERLAHAHAACGRGPVVQVGMDTPQITPALLTVVADGLADADAVLAPAADGGWWALALRDPAQAAALVDVPMSTPTTGADTAAALRAAGLTLADGPVLADVDTVVEAAEVAALAPDTRFAATWRARTTEIEAMMR